MAVQFHIRADGMPGRCQAASSDSCPMTIAGDSFHGTKAEAALESTRRFEGSFGSVPGSLRSTEETGIATAPELQEAFSLLTEESDGALRISKGEAILLSDYEDAKAELRSAGLRSMEASKARSYKPEHPLPENYRNLDPEEKAQISRSIRGRQTENRERAAILQALFEKSPHPNIAAMASYHRGEIDSWPTSYNVGSNESEILERIPSYSAEALADNEALLARLRGPSKPFGLSPMDPAMLSDLRARCEASGLEIESAIAVEVSGAVRTNQAKFAAENGVADSSPELLFHGTESHNLGGLLGDGFDLNGGVTKSGVANGTGVYLSSDPSVASAFGGATVDRSGYVVLYETVTGGPGRTQTVELKTDWDGRGAATKVPKTLGRSEDGKKNLARRTLISSPDQSTYEETFVKDPRQLVPVAILRLRGASRRAL